MTVASVAAFAYEPKLENVTAKGNKVQYEETYKSFIGTKKTRYWTYKIKSGKFIYFKSGTFDSMWSSLLARREGYNINLKVASFKDETCSTCAFIEKFKSAYENGELNETEMKQYESMVRLHLSTNNLKGAIEGKPAHAKTGTKSYYEVVTANEKKKAIDEIPFVTEENFFSLTEAELLAKVKAFVEEARKEKENKQQ